LFRFKHPLQRFHLKRCRREHDRRLASERDRRRRIEHPERIRASLYRWRESEKGRRWTKLWLRRWRKKHPDKVKEFRRKSAEGQLKRRKTPRGRVCRSCEAQDSERYWSPISSLCAACSMRGNRNGWTRDGRAKYKPIQACSHQDRQVLVALWELAGHAWPEDVYVTPTTVSLTLEQVVPLTAMSRRNVERPQWRRRARRLSAWHKLGVGRIQRGAWRLVLEVARTREGCARVLDKIARSEPRAADEDAA
jgi:hypothetical protein